MSLTIKIFGKAHCQLCEQTQKKIEHFLKKWKLDNDVEIVYHDITTIDGDAEASFYDVMNVPTTIIEQDDRELRRWNGPSDNMLSEDVHKVLVGTDA